jgi:hypothetical protein
VQVNALTPYGLQYNYYSFKTFFEDLIELYEQNYYDKGDSGMDLENLGNGSLVTFMIISPVLLICYILDGRFAVQSLFLEYVSIIS